MQMKTVVVIDGGGRGSALVDKYAQSKLVGKIIVIPGNLLMQINTAKKVEIYPELKTTSIQEILEICKKKKVDLVDVAQDNAVETGLVDALLKSGFCVVGPTRAAGQIEWDKAWSREFMKKHNISSPEFEIFSSQKDGIKYVKKQKEGAWFIKAAGLAEGKGAIPARNKKEAIEAIKEMGRFGKAGEVYLVEKWIQGDLSEEFSAFALCDGENFMIVGYAQDHKRVNNGDEGENTGGMGCSNPPLIVDKKVARQVEEIFKKTLQGLKYEGRPYKGVLYLGGIVISKKSSSRHPELVSGSQDLEKKVFIIEFNARWGDPEAQAILSGIKNDLYKISEAIFKGNIKKLKIQTDSKSRIVVAACSKGYPVDYSKVRGKQIFGLETVIKMKGIKVYGAGVKVENKKYLANGGRLFYIVAEGNNVIEAREKAYAAMSHIYIEGNNLHFRTDIGYRDVSRLIKF